MTGPEQQALRPETLTPAFVNLLKKSVEEHSTDSRRLAVALVLSHETVRSQWKTILRVLDVHCRYAAVLKAQRQGIIPATEGSTASDSDGLR